MIKDDDSVEGEVDSVEGEVEEVDKVEGKVGEFLL